MPKVKSSPPGQDRLFVAGVLELCQVLVQRLQADLGAPLVSGSARHRYAPDHHLMYGGAPCDPTTLAAAMEQLGHVSFTQLYGLTEFAPPLTRLAAHEHRDHPGSAGRSSARTSLRVVDNQDRDVPPGVVGEVICRGGKLMLGYWGQPGETNRVLRGGWLHTGDLGYLDKDGYLHLVDRLKDMIITGGENVYSTEVENAISAHPAVAACAVIGVADPDWGERVHAVVVPRPGQTVTGEELAEHCATLIAGYKKPRSFEFVEALPLSAAGKVLKRELRESVLAQAGPTSRKKPGCDGWL